ncbi:DUF4304 domain-containing protein [Paenibacillaceae sp. P-4]|uniref:DUF4304 domain-containing protein n=1 Tax=Paenibacillaceae bacterium P-4 TaxID=3160969 RepID=UPI0032E80C06
MQELFNEMMKKDVKPFLSSHGFTKKNLNFYKTKEDLVYMFNFQKSTGSALHHVMFYINCGIYSTELAQLQSKEIKTAPKESECHYRSRIEEISTAAPDRFSITLDTNMGQFKKELLQFLGEVIDFFETMTSARSIADQYISKSSLHLSEEIFHLLLQSNDILAAKHYSRGLQVKYGSENRWIIFDKKYEDIFGKYGVEFEKL